MPKRKLFSSRYLGISAKRPERISPELRESLESRLARKRKERLDTEAKEAKGRSEGAYKDYVARRQGFKGGQSEVDKFTWGTRYLQLVDAFTGLKVKKGRSPLSRAEAEQLAGFLAPSSLKLRGAAAKASREALELAKKLTGPPSVKGYPQTVSERGMSAHLKQDVRKEVHLPLRARLITVTGADPLEMTHVQLVQRLGDAVKGMELARNASHHRISRKTADAAAEEFHKEVKFLKDVLRSRGVSESEISQTEYDLKGGLKDFLWKVNLSKKTAEQSFEKALKDSFIGESFEVPGTRKELQPQVLPTPKHARSRANTRKPQRSQEKENTPPANAKTNAVKPVPFAITPEFMARMMRDGRIANSAYKFKKLEGMTKDGLVSQVIKDLEEKGEQFTRSEVVNVLRVTPYWARLKD